MFSVQVLQRVWLWLTSHGIKVLVPALLVLVSACGGGGGSSLPPGGGGGGAPTLTAITVTPASTSVTVAGTRQFTATGTYSDGSTADITSAAIWTSGTPSVATVNTTGPTTDVAVGTTTITAVSVTMSGSATLTVTVTGGGAGGGWKAGQPQHL